jgi:hypothetical protein
MNFETISVRVEIFTVDSAHRKNYLATHPEEKAGQPGSYRGGPAFTDGLYKNDSGVILRQ